MTTSPYTDHYLSIKLSDEVILEKINNHETLDFTGLDPNENGSSTPLTYAIYNDKKDLFDLLITNGANVNYGTERYDWKPLTYAMQSSNQYYLNALCQNSKIEFEHQVNDSNFLEHFMSIQSLNRPLTEKQIMGNCALLIEHLKNSSHLDIKKFNIEPIFDNIWPHLYHYKTLIRKLPANWLKDAINYKISKSYGSPHMALKVIDIVGHDKILLKKALKQLNVNEVLDEKGNTLLHYYIFKNYPGAKNQYQKTNESVIELLLKIGFDPKTKNNEGLAPIDKIQSMPLFISYEKDLLEKNYINDESIMNNPKTKKKLKI